MTDRYAVIGHPIEHSLSPRIHAAFARETGQALTYERILGDLEQFEEQVRAFFHQGGRGMNVTLPFKERAWDLVQERSPVAESAGAVNTLLPLPDGGLRGENTDGIGLVRDLRENHHFTFTGKQVLVLGAGGAARGILGPLLETGLDGLTIANRTVEKALALAEYFAAQGPVRSCGFEALAGERFDLILNATSAGLSGKVPQIPPCLNAGGWIYDLFYDCQEPTPFCRWGAAQGAAETIDGLGMLVEQAAESFFLWRGVRPSTRPVIAALRDS